MKRKRLDRPAELSVAERELVARIDWLIRLRWFAAAGVLLVAAFTRYVLGIRFSITPVVLIALAIFAANGLFYLYQRTFRRELHQRTLGAVNRFANVQISTDLSALALLIYFSGGVENPFLFYFVFHMIIASILLSTRAAYLQATYAALLVDGMIFLNAFGVLPHVAIHGFLPEGVHARVLYVTGVAFALTTTLYLSVYMATSITQKLREKEEDLLDLKRSVEKQNRELDGVNRKLLELDELKSEFMERAARELKTPLLAVESCLQVLLADSGLALGIKEREMVRRAEGRVSSLVNIVQDLLQLSRLKALHSAASFGPVDLSAALRKTVDLLGVKADKRGQRLSADIPEELPSLFGDREALEHVVSNLLNNAFRYTPAGGDVRVSVAAAPEGIVLGVADTGIGIPSADLPHIFEEFYRAENACHFEESGTGLGLSIVRRIVGLHGGRIDVESKAGEGTRFRVVFPTVPGEADA